MYRSVLYFVFTAVITANPVLAEDRTNSSTIIGPNQYLVEGYHAMIVGDYEEAVFNYEKGLRLGVSGRDRADALSNLCAGYTMLKQYNKAVTSCSRSLEINHSNWHAFNNRALALMGLNKLMEAEADVASGLALRPDAKKLLRTQEILLGKKRQPRVTIEDHS